MGDVFEVAPSAVRNVMLEKLMRPLGVLSLATVANGIFLEWHLRGRLYESLVAGEAQEISVCDVIALAERAQQIRTEVIDDIAAIVSTSLTSAGCVATAALAKIPWRRNGSRHAEPRSHATKE